MLFFIISNFLVCSTSSLHNCFDKKGTAIFYLNVHIDEKALIEMASSQGIEKQIQAGYVVLNEMFDELNRKLTPVGVQIHVNYNTTPTTLFSYNHERCVDLVPHYTRGSIASEYLKSENDSIKKNEYLGNHLVVLFCESQRSGKLYAKKEIDGCSSVMTVVYGTYKNLNESIGKVIKEGVFKSFTDEDLKFKPCEVARRCITGEKTNIGKYQTDLKAIRHIFPDKFILSDGDSVHENDLYDDTILQHYRK